MSDIVIHPNGAMYFVTGGRRNPTKLYKVTYQGNEPTAPVDLTPAQSPERKLRQLRLELGAEHAPITAGDASRDAVELAWPHLTHPDRNIRYAARTVLEHQPLASWQPRALAEDDPIATIETIIALARCGDKAQKHAILSRLNRLRFGSLALEQQLDLIRAYGLVFIRMGGPSGVEEEATVARLVKTLSPLYPSGIISLDHEMCQMLLYLNAPGAVTASVAQLEAADTQSEQMFYAYHLRTIKDGWSDDDLRKYFGWIRYAHSHTGDYIGGGHFMNFLKMVDKQATERLSPAQAEVAATIEVSSAIVLNGLGS